MGMMGPYGGTGPAFSGLALAGAVAASLGGALIGAGAVWARLEPGAGEGEALPALFSLAGVAGVALTTVSLGVLYALLARARPGSGAAFAAAVGAACSLVGLGALAWLVVRDPAAVSSGGSSGESFLFLEISVVAVWGRVLAVFAFCLAAFLAGAGRWFVLLLLLALLETPAVVAGAYGLLGAGPEAGLAGLLLGDPGAPLVRPGLLSGALWVLAGYALMESGFEPGRWGMEPRRFRGRRSRMHR